MKLISVIYSPGEQDSVTVLSTNDQLSLPFSFFTSFDKFICHLKSLGGKQRWEQFESNCVHWSLAAWLSYYLASAGNISVSFNKKHFYIQTTNVYIKLSLCRLPKKRVMPSKSRLEQPLHNLIAWLGCMNPTPLPPATTGCSESTERGLPRRPLLNRL